MDYVGVMKTECLDDAELEECMHAAVARGEFATVEEARADFWVKLDRSIAQADAGERHDIELVWAAIRDRLTNLPHVAE